MSGDHHQNSEADGRAGQLGRWRGLAREMENKAHLAFPSGTAALIQECVLCKRVFGDRKKAIWSEAAFLGHFRGLMNLDEGV